MNKAKELLQNNVLQQFLAVLVVSR